MTRRDDPPGAGVFASLLSDVAARRKSFTVYARDRAAADAVVDRFATRNVDVDWRSLPEGVPEGFLVIADEDDEFAGTVGLSTLDHLIAPPVVDPWGPEEVPEWYRELLAVLDGTVFATLDRRQLLATSREIEDRAWRVGRGELRVGFQSRSAFERQRDLYRRLARSSDLDVHLYGHPDWYPGPIDGVTVHAVSGSEIGRYWFVAYDGGGEEDQATLLVAEERDPGEFYGFWTYDAGTVRRVIDALDRAYG